MTVYELRLKKVTKVIHMVIPQLRLLGPRNRRYFDTIRVLRGSF